MFGRPQTVEAEISGEPRKPDFLVPHTLVGTVVPAIAVEPHHHADVHRTLRRVYCCLSQRQFPVPVRGGSLAMLAELGMAAAIPHDAPNLLALDVAIDAGHP